MESALIIVGGFLLNQPRCSLATWDSVTESRHTSHVTTRHLLHEYGVVSLRSHGGVSQAQEGAKPGRKESGFGSEEGSSARTLNKGSTVLPRKPSTEDKRG